MADPIYRGPEIGAHKGHHGGIGGWGLGSPHEEDTVKIPVIEDEDDEMDWNQAQDVVERIAEMKTSVGGHWEQR